MVLTLISDVMDGEWGDWLREVISFNFPVSTVAPKREEQSVLPICSVKNR